MYMNDSEVAKSMIILASLLKPKGFLFIRDWGHERKTTLGTGLINRTPSDRICPKSSSFMRQISPPLSSFYHSQNRKKMVKLVYSIYFESINTQNFPYCLVLAIASEFTTRRKRMLFCVYDAAHNRKALILVAIGKTGSYPCV